jgi:NitT/TauT family transport system permease protein
MKAPISRWCARCAGSWKSDVKRVRSYIVSVLMLAAVWKLLSMLISTAVLPSPESALAAFGPALLTAEFWKHFGASALRVTSAMATAWLAGFPLGILLGYHRRADRLLSPFVFLTYPIPKIVLLPIFLVLFGLGDAPKILMIALIIGYQIVVTTRDAVLGIDKKYFDSFRSLGGTAPQAVVHILIPASLPQAFTALRIGTGTGIAVLFFIESFATATGLGFLIMDAWGRFDYDAMFVGIIGMSVLGVLLYEAFNYLEKHLCTWKYLEAGRARPDDTQTE